MNATSNPPATATMGAAIGSDLQQIGVRSGLLGGITQHRWSVTVPTAPDLPRGSGAPGTDAQRAPYTLDILATGQAVLLCGADIAELLVTVNGDNDDLGRLFCYSTKPDGIGSYGEPISEMPRWMRGAVSGAMRGDHQPRTEVLVGQLVSR